MDRRRRLICLILPAGLALAAAGVPAPAQTGGPELLPPSAAFKLEVSRPQAERVEVRWTIAEGYYLYRERFRFEAAPARVAASFILPAGLVKQDPFFGETQIYRRRLEFQLPLEAGPAPQAPVSLRITSQGCADVGICFPPEMREVRLAVGETALVEGTDPFAAREAEGPEDLPFPGGARLGRPPATRPPP